MFRHQTQNNGFCIPRVNILRPKSRGRSPRDEGMQYVHPRDAKTIVLGLMSEQLYCLYLHYMNDFLMWNYIKLTKNCFTSETISIVTTFFLSNWSDFTKNFKSVAIEIAALGVQFLLLLLFFVKLKWFHIKNFFWVFATKIVTIYSL